jgi:AcrR family transcriptional regulator
MKTKDRIIDSAIALFSEKGYEGTSMRELAKKSGLTAAGIYNHFNNKTEILRAIQTIFLDDLIKAVEKYPANASAKKKIENATLNIMKAIKNNLRPFKIMILEAHHFLPPDRRELKVKAIRFEELVKGIIDEGVKSGEFKTRGKVKREQLIKLSTFFLIGGCNYSTLWYNPKGKLSYKDIAGLFSTIFLNGLCGKQDFTDAQ